MADNQLHLTKLCIALLILPLAIKTSLPPTGFSQPSGAKAKDDYVKGSKQLTLMILLHLISYAILSIYFFFHQEDSMFLSSSPLYHSWHLYEFIVAIFAIGGSLLRWSSFRALGQYFTYQVGIQRGHQLITYGPYSYLMHPSYTGALFGHVGSCWFLGFRKPFLVFLFAASFLYVLRLRIINEERILREHFGNNAWSRYANPRYRLIPLIY